MRIGPRLLFVCVLASLAWCAPARAADTLSVYVSNQSIALGEPATLAAHAETDAGYGGGHIVFKYQGADQDCAASAAADSGADATGDQPQAIPAGAGAVDVGGQQVQLDVGHWRVCGWLQDDAAGTSVAVGSAVLEVVPYRGSISISIKRILQTFQVNLSWSTSAAATLYASIQQAGRACSRTPGRVGRHAVFLVPRAGRFVGSDGGLGRAVDVKQLSPGRWRVCAWLASMDVGSAGPVTKSFAVPRQRQRAARASG